MTAERNIYLEFVHYLTTVGVRYAILHNWEAVVRGKTTDIDIVLSAADLERLEASLLARYSVLNVFHYEACSFYFVLTPKDDDRVLPFMVDVSTHYWCRGRIFFTDDELLVNRRLCQGMWVVGPKEEFAYLLIKKIYDKEAIPQHQKIRLTQLVEELGHHAVEVASKHFGETCGKQLVCWMVHQQWDEIENRIKRLRRTLRRQVMKHDRFNSLKYWAREIPRIWKRWRYPTGICIAVVSKDPQKKTALISAIKSGLQGAFRRTASFSDRLGRLRYKADVSQKPTGSFGRSWLRFHSRLLDDLAFLIKIRPLLARSTLVFLDFDNSISAEPLGRNTKWPSLIRWTQRLALRPDIIFILDNNGSQPTAERDVTNNCLVNGEVSGKAHESSYALLLNGSSSSEKIAHRAKEVLSAHLYKRYLQRRDCWFGGHESQALHRSRKQALSR